MDITQRQIYQIVAKFTGQANVITTPVTFIDFTGGDHIAALLLNQIIYWTERTHDKDGWFYKSAKDWHEELRLSSFQVNRALKVLKPLGVETKLKRANNAPTIHYRINRELFSSAFFKFLENRETQKSRNLEMDIEETSKSDLQVSQKTLTEITTENTTEIREGAEAPVPPAKKHRGKSKSNPLSSNPLIVGFHEVIGLYPNDVQMEDIVKEVTDPQLWEQCCRYWKRRGYSPKNVDGLLDVYHKGGPAKDRRAGIQLVTRQPFKQVTKPFDLEEYDKSQVIPEWAMRYQR